MTTGQDGTTANGRSMVGAISEDGRYVAYISEANDIKDTDDTNDGVGFGYVARDVFVFDRVTGETKIYTHGGDNRITQAVAVWAVDKNGIPSFSTDYVSRFGAGGEWFVHHAYYTPHYSGTGNPYGAPMAWHSEGGSYAVSQEAEATEPHRPGSVFIAY